LANRSSLGAEGTSTGRGSVDERWLTTIAFRRLLASRGSHAVEHALLHAHLIAYEPHATAAAGVNSTCYVQLEPDFVASHKPHEGIVARPVIRVASVVQDRSRMAGRASRRRSLALLLSEGNSDAEAIRVALREAADRRRRSALRREAKRVAADAADDAECRRVRADMDVMALPCPKPRSSDEFRRLGRSTRTYAVEPPTGGPP
jgi:hypothetical protein